MNTAGRASFNPNPIPEIKKPKGCMNDWQLMTLVVTSYMQNRMFVYVYWANLSCLGSKYYIEKLIESNSP